MNHCFSYLGIALKLAVLFVGSWCLGKLSLCMDRQHTARRFLLQAGDCAPQPGNM
jgi:hypothetical protein